MLIRRDLRPVIFNFFKLLSMPLVLTPLDDTEANEATLVVHQLH